MRFLPALKKPKQAIIYIIVLVSFIIALINITSIVTEIHNAMPGKLSFIEKTYSLLSRTSGDFSNGRFKIIANVFKEYEMKDFIFGIGVGTYNNTHVEEGYTHNLFVSVLLDFGIIGVVLLCAILVLFIYYMFKDGEHALFMVLLFTVSVVTLLFSGNYWKFFTLWLFIFFALSFNDSLKRKEAIVNDELNELQRGVYA